MCNLLHTRMGSYMHLQASLPWAPAPTGPLAGPLGAPRACATLQGSRAQTTGHVYMCTHMCTQACCHPSCSRAKSSHRAGGLPRCSCWVTARSNDAMSSFAYAKQHLCCRVPREEALLPAPRDPAGMPKDANASSMHVFPTLPWPHTLAWACFINSYYVR